MNILIVGNINWLNLREMHIKPLQRAGHEVTVLSDVQAEKKEFLKDINLIVLNKKSWTIRAVSIMVKQLFHLLIRGNILDRKELKRIRFLFSRSLLFQKQIKETVNSGFDVVHCHFLTRPACIAVIATPQKIPLICTIHGSDIHLSPHYSAADLDYISTCFERSAAIIVPGQGEFDKAIGLGCKAEKLYKCPWGVDSSTFSPATDITEQNSLKKKWELSDQYVVLSTRNHNDLYNIESVIEAFSRAKIDKKSTLVIAGGGEDTVKLKDLANQLAISHRTRFTGPLTHTKLCELYKLSDLYIQNPKSDALPYSMLESIACGTPIVCGLLGSIGDVVRCFEKQKYLTSFYFNDGVQTITALSQLLEQAYQSGTKYFSQDAEYISFIEDNYSTNSYTKFVLNIYRDLAVNYTK